MTWVTVIWSMVASACLTLAAMHLLVWYRMPRTWANLLYSLTALATTGLAGCELWMMRAQTSEQFGTALRWLHVPAWAMIVSLVLFVRLHLRAGRPWLAWTVCTLRTFSLLMNFLVGQNLNYREVTGLRHIPFIGESVSVAEGVSNPWMLVGQLSLVLWVAFVADAATTVWRRGNRREALVVGGSIMFFVLASTVQAVLVLWQIIHSPLTTSLFYLGVVAVMAYEMSREPLRATQLSEDLRQSQERLRQAAQAAGFGVYLYDFATDETSYSTEFLALHGLPVDATLELDSDLVPKAIHPDDKAGFLAGMKAANDPHGPGTLDLEYRISRRDGQLRWLRARGRTVFTGSGQSIRPLRLDGILQDTTERKRLELELRQGLDEVQRLRDQLQMENMYLREQVKRADGHDEILGESEAILQMLAKAKQVALTDTAVLITGETGTGKELLAQAIHDMSRRKTRSMVKVNCAALPAPLIESELFGREKGAFTGAMTRQIGRFELADGSTIFLDEIGDLPVDLQVKLLRVLQDGGFERLGSNHTITADVRVIAATNHNLGGMVRNGTFREDLFHRLDVFPIEAPPLRARVDDIPLLTWKFVAEFNKKMGRSIDSIPKHVMEQLKQYPWPGNVRELRNLVERAAIVSTGRALKIELPSVDNGLEPLPVTLEEAERKHILEMLERVHWRISGHDGAAEILGVRPTTLHSRMKKLGISRPKT